MSNNFQYKAGKSLVGAYQISGLPYIYRGSFPNVTGSVAEEQLDFPSITRDFTVVNESVNASGTVMRLHFASRTDVDHSASVVDASGTGHNIPIYPSGSVHMDVRCRTIFISRDSMATGSITYYSVYGVLTGINDTINISGSAVGTD